MLVYSDFKAYIYRKFGSIFRKVYGIGKSRSDYICFSFGFNKNIPSYFINFYYYKFFSIFIRRYYFIETKLRRFKKNNRIRMIKLNSYKGIRLEEKLPLRGQRTSSNARTRKYKNIV